MKAIVEHEKEVEEKNKRQSRRRSSTKRKHKHHHKEDEDDTPFDETWTQPSAKDVDGKSFALPNHVKRGKLKLAGEGGGGGVKVKRQKRQKTGNDGGNDDAENNLNNLSTPTTNSGNTVIQPPLTSSPSSVLKENELLKARISTLESLYSQTAANYKKSTSRQIEKLLCVVCIM
jgi:hypothetical protein